MHEEFLNKQMGRCKFIYNKLLEVAKRDYGQESKKCVRGTTTRGSQHHRRNFLHTQLRTHQGSL